VKDKGENIYPGQGTPMQRQALTKRERHHQKRVGSLASQAIFSGRNMMRKIEEGLYYHMGVTSSSIEKDMKTLPRSAKLLCHFVNMEKQLKQAYYPFTLSISNPEALFDFYDGQLSITIFVDLNVVESFFVQRGFSVKFLDDETYFLYLDHPTANIRHAQVSVHYVGRLFAEFLSLRWMIEETSDRILNSTMPTEATLEEIEKINRAGLSHYKDEEIAKNVEQFMRLTKH